MKKFWLFFFCFFTGFATIQAQNLLRNANFEHSNACPDGISQIEKLEEWFLVSNSPDYYNCSYDRVSLSRPLSAIYSGKGSVGILSSYDGTISRTEAIGQRLASPLLPNRFYRLTFMARSESVGTHSEICRGIELHGFKNEYTANTNFDHLSKKGDAILLGKSELVTSIDWDRKTINFLTRDTIQILAISMEEGVCKQYVMIDELSLRRININELNSEIVCTIFPNPSNINSEINLSSNQKIESLEVYGVKGNLLLSQKVNFNNATFSVAEVGVYFVVFRVNGQSFTKKIIILK